MLKQKLSGHGLIREKHSASRFTIGDADYEYEVIIVKIKFLICTTNLILSIKL